MCIFLYLFIYFVVVCVCVCVVFFALTLCYILLSFLSILYSVYTRDCSCIDKSLHIVLKRGSIDKPLTFNTYRTARVIKIN